MCDEKKVHEIRIRLIDNEWVKMELNAKGEIISKKIIDNPANEFRRIMGKEEVSVF